MTSLPVSVSISDPIFKAGGRTGLNIPLAHRIGTYTHQTDADGGFKSAAISMPISPQEVGSWIASSLGQHVEVFGQSTIKAWEGYIDSIVINMGFVSFTRGPLVDIGNRITVRYTDFTVGQPANTTAQNDTDSQASYGIWHKVVNTGSVSATTADNIRNTYLQEHKLPESTTTLSAQSTEPTLTLNCQGYINWLSYPYNEVTNTTYTAREKVLEVLGDSPNTIFSTTYNHIEANTLSVNRLDNDYREALNVIRDIVALGGMSDNTRRLFGVYEDRLCYLQPIPSAIGYTMRASDPTIHDVGGKSIDPWDIRPGKWLQVVDFLPGEVSPTDLREDPRNIFIESVIYTAPYDFSINGGKTGTLTQQLSKLGLGGV